MDKPGASGSKPGVSKAWAMAAAKKKGGAADPASESEDESFGVSEASQEQFTVVEEMKKKQAADRVQRINQEQAAKTTA
jgi:hypothetical protein